jgi:hypothetical protein
MDHTTADGGEGHPTAEVPGVIIHDED